MVRTKETARKSTGAMLKASSGRNGFETLQPKAAAPVTIPVQGTVSTSAMDRVCSHMNSDHSVSVIAIARYHGAKPTATTASMTSINLEGLTLEYAIGDHPAKSVHINFIPKLNSESEFRKKLISMHDEALSPKLRLLLTPLASIPLFLILLVAFTVAFRDQYVVSSCVNRLARTLLIKDSNLTLLLIIVFFIHLTEALFAGKFAHDLKLSNFKCFCWFLLTLLGGNGTLQVVQFFADYNKLTHQASRKKSS